MSVGEDRQLLRDLMQDRIERNVRQIAEALEWPISHVSKVASNMHTAGELTSRKDDSVTCRNGTKALNVYAWAGIQPDRRRTNCFKRLEHALDWTGEQITAAALATRSALFLAFL